MGHNERHAGEPRQVASRGSGGLDDPRPGYRSHKREVFTKLAEHLATLALEIERAIARSPAEES
jgi:hypothetical protein